VSQLGFMVAAVGMGAVVAGVFHLMTHAFFKALLFLGAGSVIHGVEHGHHHVAHDGHAAHGGDEAHGDAPPTEEFDPQDMRNMGGIWNRMRTTSIVYIIGALALGGFPFVTAGFWSKDEILVEAAHKHPVALGLLLAAAGLTAFYMTRQVIMIFFGRAKTQAAAHAAESPRIMTAPLVVLAFFSIVIGFVNAPLLGIRIFSTWLEGEPHGEFEWPVALTAIGLAALAFVVGWFIYNPRKQKAEVDDPLRKTGFVFKVLNHKYWIDELYGVLFVRPFIWLSNFLAWVIDWRFWHDWFHDRALLDTFLKITDFLANPIDKLVIDGAVNGAGRLVAWASGGLRKWQSGYVRQYALVMLAGAVLVIAWFMLIVMQGR
jgi:NADH-quinone oxidoreductase subunit L